MAARVLTNRILGLKVNLTPTEIDDVTRQPNMAAFLYPPVPEMWLQVNYCFAETIQNTSVYHLSAKLSFSLPLQLIHDDKIQATYQTLDPRVLYVSVCVCACVIHAYALFSRNQ